MFSRTKYGFAALARATNIEPMQVKMMLLERILPGNNLDRSISFAVFDSNELNC